MRINVKKIVTILLDVALAVYLVFAFTSFNKPYSTTTTCSKVQINVADGATNGFIDAKEIKARLQKKSFSRLNNQCVISIQDALKRCLQRVLS